MNATGTERPLAAVWAPLEAGALLRVTVGGAPLSVAWSHPEGGTWATGVGVAAEGEAAIAWSGAPPPHLPGPWFGGWSFDGVERWVLPKVLAWWSGGRTYAAAFGDGGARTLAAIGETAPAFEGPSASARPGDRARWSALIDRALARIADGTLSKVVLARQIALEARAPFDERRILKALEARFPTCHTFLLRQPDGTALLGSSPETLCRIHGRAINTEAVAGTGTNEALLSLEKDLREHAWVVEQLVETLRPLTIELEVASAPALKRVANLCHLWTPIRGVLAEGVEPIAVARALHPTPAVGGTPRTAALDFIRAHEGFDRGWYAGAVGLRGATGLELCVAIRSARVSRLHATLTVGAGVIAGSTADAEWNETERKAQALLAALGVERG